MNEGQSRYADEGTLAYVAKLEQQLATCQAENLRLRTILGAVEIQGICPVCHQDSANTSFQAGATTEPKP